MPYSSSYILRISNISFAKCWLPDLRSRKFRYLQRGRRKSKNGGITSRTAYGKMFSYKPVIAMESVLSEWMNFAVSTHQMSKTQTCEPNPIFCWFLKFISSILSDVEKSINLVVKYILKSEHKWRRCRPKIPWPTQTTEKHCLYTFVLCPSCPCCQKIGDTCPACTMAPVSVTEFLGAEVWIWFLSHKSWNIKAKFSQ